PCRLPRRSGTWSRQATPAPSPGSRASARRRASAAADAPKRVRARRPRHLTSESSSSVQTFSLIYGRNPLSVSPYSPSPSASEYDQSAPQPQSDSLCARRRAKFSQDRRDVKFDCVLRYLQLPGDLLVAQTFGHHGEYLFLATCKGLRQLFAIERGILVIRFGRLKHF